jgi:iron(III) transport system ATP-binding protein
MVKLTDGTVWKIEDKKRVFGEGEKVFLKWEEGKEIAF